MAFRVVNELKEITIVYLSNGAATLQLFTDMPGFGPGATLAARLGAGVTLPSTSGKRQPITVPLDGIRAKEFYPQITPGASTQFELYSGVVYLRPIGVYLDGAAVPQGEVWSTVPIAPGAGGS